ncbi:membrane protein insertase YidC [Streptacidiphilus sp. N1-12]|uniref:Membrane protein insertase YidC n=2 Tax=Streptacidiphilus alkalitolerans TaxID=3342712 RepID=A0ABV6WEI8_9ACTN
MTVGFLDSILSPLYTAVSWIIVQFHTLYSQVFPADSGWAWGLAIVSLVILVRACMIPLTIKQTKSMRAMQALQPRLKVLQERYKGDRQKLSEESMKLYKEAGANPASSCLPLLIQSPFFMSLYGVLSNVAHGKTVGVITPALLVSAQQAHIFGAPLSATFFNSHIVNVKIVAAVMILTMCFTQFLTTRQLMTKNVDLSVKTPYMQQQKMMMYVFPVIYIFIGANMPVGVLIYMVTSNMWTLGQQLVIIRQNPTPGSVAFKARQERLKAAGKLNADGTPIKAGLATLVKGGAPVVEEAPEDAAPVRRQQPKRQTKAQRANAGGGGTAGTAPADAVVRTAETAAKVSTEKPAPAGKAAPAKAAAPAQARGRAKTGGGASGGAAGGTGSASGSTPAQKSGTQNGGGQGGGTQNGGQKRSNQPAKRNPQPAGRSNSKKKS